MRKNTTMKNIIRGGIAALGIAGAMAAGITLASGTAHADTDAGTIAALNAAAQFSVDITNAGFSNDYGPQQQLLLGVTICNQIDAGWTPIQEARSLASQGNLTAYQSGEFVGIAVRDLCPWNSAAVTRSASTGV